MCFRFDFSPSELIHVILYSISTDSLKLNINQKKQKTFPQPFESSKIGRKHTLKNFIQTPIT